MTLKKLTLALAALAALALHAGPAFADADATNDSDGLTITVTPSVDLGVDIDTAAVTLDLGSQALGTTQYVATPATVTVLGTFGDQEIQVQGGGGSGWSLDTDETAQENQLQLYSVFSSTGIWEVPAESIFDGTDKLVTTVATNAGEPSASEDNAGTQNYENSSQTGGADEHEMDGLAPGILRHMWFRLDLPPTTTTSSQQDFTVTLTAIDGTSN